MREPIAASGTNCSLLIRACAFITEHYVRQLGHSMREMPFEWLLARLIGSVAWGVEVYFLRLLTAFDLVVRLSMRQHVVSRMTAPLRCSG